MIVGVTGPDDPRMREYAHVGDHSWLREHGLFVVEGRLVLRRLLGSGRFALRSILLTPAALSGLGGAIGTDAPVYLAEQDVLNQITGFDFHRGCLALAARAEFPSAAGLFADARLLLAIEGVGNPDNIGGLFRVAAAFGVSGVLLDPTSGDPLYRKAIRTSMGAVLTVPFVHFGGPRGLRSTAVPGSPEGLRHSADETATPWGSELARLKAKDFKIVTLTPASEALALADFARERHGPLVVMVGSEGSGLSDEALQIADARVRIPISSDVDSLNVAVAAGIALSHLSA